MTSHRVLRSRSGKVHRPSFVLSASLAVWVGFTGCELDEERNVTGREGESCNPCGDWSRDFCDGCVDRGFDPERNQLLACGSDGVWHLLEDCPGGGFVRSVIWAGTLPRTHPRR